jgi:C4-dicarboxylate transporter, DctM subunit
MNDPWVIVLLVAVLLVGLASGAPVFLVLLVGGLAVFYLGAGTQGLDFGRSIPWQSTFSWELSALPAFVLMGHILEESGFVKHLVRGFRVWLGQVPGSLVVVVLATSGLFAAMSGSGAATLATIAVAIRPEVERYRYDRALVFGALSGGSCLAPVIPPSIGLIVYGSLVGANVTDLFAAGIIPGLLALVAMTGYVVWKCRREPELAPTPPPPAPRERLETAWVWPVSAFIVLLSVGGLLFGWYTPTEAAAIGVALATVMLFVSKRGDWRSSVSGLASAIYKATMVSAFIVFLIVTGFIFSQTLTFFGFPQLFANAVGHANLQVWQLMVVLTVFLLILGCFVDSTTMMVLTVPFLVPTLHLLNIDLIWFGIFVTFMVEIGTNTPPFGIHLFILRGVMDAPFGLAVRGAMPFNAIWLALVVLLLIFPGLATWLPSLI